LCFSCKKYKELAQARITIVVGYFTLNPTKFVLHFYDFSMIFTQFTRISKMVLLFELPNCRKALGKKFCVAMWSLGRPTGADGANSGELVAGLAREGRGKGLWATGARFAGLVGARSGLWGGRAGGQGRWPPRLPVPVRAARGEEERAGEL
jgi:hypothetical protein